MLADDQDLPPAVSRHLATRLRARGRPGDSRMSMSVDEIKDQERVAGQQLVDKLNIKEQTITLRLQPIQAFAVITQIQLASRHPGNRSRDRGGLPRQGEGAAPGRARRQPRGLCEIAGGLSDSD